jgi:hypothetical protein
VARRTGVAAPPRRHHEARHSLDADRETIIRMKMGWMNNCREEELWLLFRQEGFISVQEETRQNNRRFVFSQRHSSETDICNGRVTQ